MAPQKILVRRLSGDTPHVSTTADMRRANAVLTFVALATLVPIFIVVVADELGIRLVMGGFAILLVAVLGYVTLAKRLPRDGVVYIASRGPGLHFRPPVWTTASTVVLLVLCGLMGIGAAIAAGVDGEGFVSPRRSPLLLTVLSAVSLGVILWPLRVIPGLRLTVDGIQGIRARGEVDWLWDLVGEITVEPGRVARLGLAHAEGSPVLAVPFLMLGSDPQRAAALLRFSKDNPTERPLLAEGGAEAVRRANDVLRARQDSKG
ncbi:hypothetical protein [uncultured Microbacterium sp.]|uniref:hypothetical protein n=1 Tax=uncultured Microbacterium sp. TaxID=191216 RepID=UPI00374948F0